MTTLVWQSLAVVVHGKCNRLSLPISWLLVHKTAHYNIVMLVYLLACLLTYLFSQYSILYPPWCTPYPLTGKHREKWDTTERITRSRIYSILRRLVVITRILHVPYLQQNDVLSEINPSQ